MSTSTWQTLAISGVHLKLTDKFPPRLTMRKIYNASYFRERDERYRHEIANHYRDYKLRQPHLINANVNAAYGNDVGGNDVGVGVVAGGDGGVGGGGGNGFASGRRHKNHWQRQQVYVRPQRPIATETTSIHYAATYGDDYDYDNYDYDDKVGVGGVGNYNANNKQLMIDTNAEMQLETLTVLFNRNYIGGSRYRNELPMRTQYFPSFAKRYSPRGRQTLCEFRPPDETYNDTVRRIQNAHSCEQLKSLVDKQFSWKLQYKRRRRQQQQQQNHYSHRQTQRKGLLTSALSSSAQEEENEDEAIINNLDSLKLSKKSKKTKVNQNNKCDYSCQLQKKQPGQIDLRNYFQLASDYYESGLIADLQYLKTIGERNIVLKDHIKEQRISSNSSDFISTTSAVTTTTTSPTTSTTSSSSILNIEQQKQQLEKSERRQNRQRRRHSSVALTLTSSTANNLQLKDCRLANLLQQIKKNHSFRRTTRRRRSTIDNWPISVNITPAAATTTITTTTSSSTTLATATRIDDDDNDDDNTKVSSMNDFLNANISQNHQYRDDLNSNSNSSSNNIEQENIVSSTTSGSPSESSTATSSYDAVVNDFSQLDLIDNFTLPRIILTDCSTQQQQEQQQQQRQQQQQQLLIQSTEQYHNRTDFSGATEASGTIPSSFVVSNPSYNISSSSSSSNNNYNKDQQQQQQQQQQQEQLQQQLQQLELEFIEQQLELAFEEHQQELQQQQQQQLQQQQQQQQQQATFANNQSLDLPSEFNYYHSEARPP